MLIKCDECGRKISSKSLFCPGCGHPTHLNAGYPDAGSVPEAFEELEKVIAPAVVEEQPKAEPVQTEPVQTEPVVVEEPEAEVEASVEEEDAAERRHRRNAAAKTWLFLIVSALVLGAILFIYFTTPLVEQESEEVYEATQVDTMPIPVDTSDTVVEPEEKPIVPQPVVKKSKPVEKPAPVVEPKPAIAEEPKAEPVPAAEPAVVPAAMVEPAVTE